MTAALLIGYVVIGLVVGLLMTAGDELVARDLGDHVALGFLVLAAGSVWPLMLLLSALGWLRARLHRRPGDAVRDYARTLTPPRRKP